MKKEEKTKEDKKEKKNEFLVLERVATKCNSFHAFAKNIYIVILTEKYKQKSNERMHYFDFCFLFLTLAV